MLRVRGAPAMMPEATPALAGLTVINAAVIAAAAAILRNCMFPLLFERRFLKNLVPQPEAKMLLCAGPIWGRAGRR